MTCFRPSMQVTRHTAVFYTCDEISEEKGGGGFWANLIGCLEIAGFSLPRHSDQTLRSKGTVTQRRHCNHTRAKMIPRSLWRATETAFFQLRMRLFVDERLLLPCT